jgi:site-specific recombinase XerD
MKQTREELLRTGYTRLTLKFFDRTWAELERYLREKGIVNFSLDAGMAFLNERYHYSAAPNSHANTDRLRAIQLLADYQSHERIMIRRKRCQSVIAQPFHDIFQAFMHARAREGISCRTLESYRIYLTRFAQYLAGHQVQSVSQINVSHVHGFIQATSAAYRTATLYCTSCLLRVLFRYLYAQLLQAKNLAPAVPSIRCTKKSKIPSAYSQEEIQRILSSIDRGNPKGKRDYAMILIAVRLGLRASDICRLTFDNLRWETDTIELIQKKTAERITLPLLNDVGEAIIDYIKYGRPAVQGQDVFIRLTSPLGPMKPPSLHSIVTFYMTRAEIMIPEGKKHGPHALRHSLASALLNHKTPMPVISEILGHTDSQTTSAYLKIDILHLRDYALDVPPANIVYLGG